VQHNNQLKNAKFEKGGSWVAPVEMNSVSLTASFKSGVKRLNETDNPTG
jgi:hypothetical protein